MGGGGGTGVSPVLTSDAVWPALPAAVTESTIYRSGGILIMDFPGPETLTALRSEALQVRERGWRNEWSGPDVTVERGGNPSRAFRGAHAGEVQWNLFSAATTVSEIASACGLAATPTGGGTYSYYEQPGDFLALHRDIESCDLTLITCLWDTAPADKIGALLVYREHINQPLEAARRAGWTSAAAITLLPGQSAVLLGGVVPHEVSPMAEGQNRIVAVMCYRVGGMS
jgi:hypothetical protein